MTITLGILASSVANSIAGGVLDSAFNTNVGNNGSPLTQSISVASDGKIVVGGGFTQWNGSATGCLIRLNSDGTMDTSFLTAIGTGGDGNVLASAIQPSDNQIVLGGWFRTWNGATAGGIVRITSAGATDSTFRTNTNASGTDADVYTVAVQTDGKIIAGGIFNTWNGLSTLGNIVRLNSDGTRDTAFSTNAGTAAAGFSISHIALQSDGKILVGGTFTTWNGVSVGNIVRLNSNGTRDTTFTTNNGTGANDAVERIAIQTDGKILVCGWFTTWNGTTVNRIVRLNSDGTRDTTFTTNTGTGANATVETIAVQSTGKIVVGGWFTSWNGNAVGRYIRLNSDGTLDAPFTTSIGTGPEAGPNPNVRVEATVTESTGTLLACGNFTTWNGTSVGRLVRLSGA